MPRLVKYEDLQPYQKCVYQAFGCLHGVRHTGSQMGAYVNGLGIDADDDAAVQALADRYGLTDVEMFRGESWNSGEYNLNQNHEYVLTINSQRGMIGEFEAMLGEVDGHKEVVIKGVTAVKGIQKKYPREVGHTVYCKTKRTSSKTEAWNDIQKIYKKPAPDFSTPTLVVAYGRARQD